MSAQRDARPDRGEQKKKSLTRQEWENREGHTGKERSSREVVGRQKEDRVNVRMIEGPEI